MQPVANSTVTQPPNSAFGKAGGLGISEQKLQKIAAKIKMADSLRVTATAPQGQPHQASPNMGVASGTVNRVKVGRIPSTNPVNASQPSSVANSNSNQSQRIKLMDDPYSPDFGEKRNSVPLDDSVQSSGSNSLPPADGSDNYYGVDKLGPQSIFRAPASKNSGPREHCYPDHRQSVNIRPTDNSFQSHNSEGLHRTPETRPPQQSYYEYFPSSASHHPPSQQNLSSISKDKHHQNTGPQSSQTEHVDTRYQGSSKAARQANMSAYDY